MRCAADIRCRARDEHGYPAETDALLCFYCLEGAERDVRALVLDYRDLEQHLAPSLGQRGSGLPTGRGGLPPLPIAEHVLDLQREIWWVLTAWEEPVRDAAGLSEIADWSKRRRDGAAVAGAVRVLAPRLDVLARIEAVEMWRYPGYPTAVDLPGWQGVLDLAHLHERARHALGLTRQQPELCAGIACRGCNAAALYRVVGEDAVTCGRCGLYYSATDYAEWTARLAGSVGRDRAA